ncbi:hypothetical protein [Bradyrhizobium paxllaeri]|uniref:hypothetical protein n=1 Tax=Bradyrhizobium paxllaeri TaxID=190148 RepID=UPI001FE8B11D|nr:hypothetical protein [Bradyrhizobium paxllaeri]
MRSDPYQERARALAVEAGLDPDAKIDRPGQRPMPTWCLFRDAARKEKLARDAEAVASDIALRPQAEQYQNSPLKIFGTHDDATIAQMRNCMSVGQRGRRGDLCGRSSRLCAAGRWRHRL